MGTIRINLNFGLSLYIFKDIGRHPLTFFSFHLAKIINFILNKVVTTSSANNLAYSKIGCYFSDNANGIAVFEETLTSSQCNSALTNFNGSICDCEYGTVGSTTYFVLYSNTSMTIEKCLQYLDHLMVLPLDS